MRVLKTDSLLYAKIEEVERLMDKHGLVVHGCYLTMTDKEGKEFQIGRDQDSFPRFIDEPFILKE